MSASLATHSLLNWVVQFGFEIISGFDESAAVTIEYPNDKYNIIEGADGRITRSLNPNWLRATVTITLQDSSKSNPAIQLTTLLNGTTNLDALKINIANPLTGQGYIGAEAFVSKQTDAEIGMDSTTREWKIEVVKLIPSEPGIN